MRRYIKIQVLCFFVGLSACAHGDKPCPVVAPTPVASSEPAKASSLAWVDGASIAEAQDPLALYDARWLVLTGDSGAYATVPPNLHNFTLGRWECALGAEKTADELADGRAHVHRERRLVCTHPTGVVAQSELTCDWQSPAPIRAGSPTLGKRELHLSLSDAPSVSVSCEPEAKPRLPIYQRDRERTAEACVIDGQIKPCPAETH